MAEARAEALAARPVDVDDDVAELGRRTDRAPVELAVQDEPAADPRAEGEEHHVLGAPAGPEAVLGERRAVRVVLERDREPEAVGEQVAQRHVLERDVDGGPRPAGSLVDERGDPDAERDDLGIEQLVDRALDLRERGPPRWTCRSRAARGGEPSLPGRRRPPQAWCRPGRAR